MNLNYRVFDGYKQQGRRDLFEATAVKLGTNAQSVEKDFWVCRTIDGLFKGLPRQPKLFFKGGTSLSKGFGLIRRFSEDIDIVFSRNGLLLGPDRDPFVDGLSAKKRKERFEALTEICAQHVGGKMKTRLAKLMPLCEHGSPWTVETARERAAQALRDATVGIDPSAEKREARADFTVKELFELYKAEGPDDTSTKRPRTWEVEFSALRRHVLPLLGSKATRQLSPDMIRKWQSDVVAGKTAVDERTKARGRSIVTGGHGAATRAMSALSSMLTWAAKGGLIQSNPALKVEKLKQRRRNRFLSEEEARRMFAVMADLLANGQIQQSHHDVLFLLGLTGARPSEIMGLRWSELDLARGFAAIPPNRHKTGASGELRVIQFDKTAIDLLCSRPRDTEWVFPDATGLKPLSRVQDAWEKVRDAADLKDAVVYTLRHSFASFAIDQGESLYVVGRAMGHRKAATTERYAHVRDALAQRVVAGVGARLASLAADRDKSGE